MTFTPEMLATMSADEIADLIVESSDWDEDAAEWKTFGVVLDEWETFE